jgi:hypothetical protein
VQQPPGQVVLPVLLDHELPWGQLPAVGMRSVLTSTAVDQAGVASGR